MTDPTTHPETVAGAEPVAWRFRSNDGYGSWSYCPERPDYLNRAAYRVEPLYTHPTPIEEPSREVVALKIANAMLEYARLDRSQKFSERVKSLNFIASEAADDILALFRPAASSDGEG